MSLLKFFSLCLLVYPVCFNTAFAQSDTEKIGIYIHNTQLADDSVGTDLGYKLREVILGSERFALAIFPSQSRFVIRLVSLPADNGDKIAHSATLNLRSGRQILPEYYLTSFVGFCVEPTMLQCADRLFKEIETHIVINEKPEWYQ